VSARPLILIRPHVCVRARYLSARHSRQLGDASLKSESAHSQSGEMASRSWWESGQPMLRSKATCEETWSLSDHLSGEMGHDVHEG
jgi:hypothetical protein